MNANTQNTETMDELDAEIAALMADANDGESGDSNVEIEALPEVEMVLVEEVLEASDDDLEEIESGLVAEEIRDAAYASQIDEAEVIETTGAEAEEVIASSAATPITAAKKKTATPRVTGSPSVVLKASYTDEEAMSKVAMLVTPSDGSEDAFNALCKSLDAVAKKVGQKAINLLRHSDNPTKVENYTRLGLNALIKSSQVSSADLFATLKTAGYTDGTARAQANQLMSLFPTLGVATRTGRSQLELNADSPLVKRFTSATA